MKFEENKPSGFRGEVIQRCEWMDRRMDDSFREDVQRCGQTMNSKWSQQLILSLKSEENWPRGFWGEVIQRCGQTMDSN